MPVNRRSALKTLGGAAATGMVAGTTGPSSVFARNDSPPSQPREPMAPIKNIDLYFCGFHIAKTNPNFQIETQHYCTAHGDDMHQCVLFDTNDANAKLLGVEYIISDKLYQELPEEEKKYWHPHTYEVLGGQLIAPNLSPEEEASFMKSLITTWGKAIHVWPDPSTKVPLGDPLLMWSVMGDGQLDPKLLNARDQRFNVDSEMISAHRQERYNLPEPYVSMPESMNSHGRQWTDEGPDTPEARWRQLR